MKKSRTALVLVAIYLSLVFLSLASMAYALNVTPGTSELCGVPAIFLTIPWSMMSFSILDKMMPHLLMSVTITVIIFSALLNALILYWIGKWLGKYLG